LNATRKQKQHLHSGNWAHHYYRKDQRFMEQRGDVKGDFAIKVNQLSTMQQQADTERMIATISALIDGLEDQVCSQIRTFFWQTMQK